MKSRLAAGIVSLGVASMGCADAQTKPIAAPLPAIASPAPTSGSQAAVNAKEGSLIVYRAGQRIGEERYRDDGTTLASELELAGKRAKVAIDRKARSARVEADGAVVERAIADGAFALENGSFQAYALIAEAMPIAADEKTISVLLPGRGLALDGRVTVAARDGGGKRVRLVLHGLEVIVDLAEDGRTERAEVPAQSLVVLREGAPKPDVGRPAPASVTRESIELARGGVALRGELWVPRGASSPPVALIIAGSGPTDRDGNSGAALASDAYRLLAEALAERGVATLRFDKRGVGESGVTFDPSKAVFQDFVEDAKLFAASLRADKRFSSVALVGHSEGGLLAMSIAGDDAPAIDALVLVATPGRPLATLLREQLASKVSKETLAIADRSIADLRAGRALGDVPAELAPLFAPAARAFLKSAMDLDPKALGARVKARTTIVQGEHDAQVRVVDAEALAKAIHGAKVVRFAKMSHVLKDEASASLPQASYSDPKLPLAPGVADAIAAAVKR